MACIIISNNPQFVDPILDGSDEDDMTDFIVEDDVADEHGGPSW